MGVGAGRPTARCAVMTTEQDRANLTTETSATGSEVRRAALTQR